MATVNTRRLWVFRLLSVALGIGAALAGLEVLTAAYLTVRDGRYTPARQRFAEGQNAFVTQLTGNSSTCRYIDSLFPHPYLGFVHHANPPCGYIVNNIGLFGPDFPSERQAGRFVVLSTGGSVASQLGSVQGTPPYLQDALNQKYISPNGKPFLVLNGADGGWKQPQQLFLFLLYADAVDAVVTLDGFNEHYLLQDGERFEYPPSNFSLVNPLADRDFAGVVRLWLLGKMGAFFQANAVLSRSHAAFLVTRYLQNSAAAAQKQHTTLQSIFALPAAWDAEKRFRWSIGQYRKYLLAMHAVARQQHIPASFFVQPVPAFGKPLTDQEKTAVGDLSYGPIYQRMTGQLMSLAGDGVPIHNLRDVFAARTDTLYVDAIHFNFRTPGGNPGYRLMAERMAADIARDWNLKPKH
jgi:hypothetical protein